MIFYGGWLPHGIGDDAPIKAETSEVYYVCICPAITLIDKKKTKRGAC
jgi:hypothetical protein